MLRKNVILLTSIVIAIFICALAYKKNVEENRHNIISNIDVSRTTTADRVFVLSGHEFDIVLSDGNRIRARLPVTSVPEATLQVTKLIHQSVAKPQVFLKERVGTLDGFWLVEIRVIIDPVAKIEIDLSTWLIENGLAWS